MRPTAKYRMLFWPVLLGSLSRSVSYAAHCPLDCMCDDSTIDCSNQQLTAVPQLQPRSAAVVVNFSSNSITSLDNLYTSPAIQVSLDLSFNRISSIPAQAFSGEQFLDLHMLNLSHNLISEAHFLFPSSLKVLKLSKNRIKRICVSRLRSMQQLRSLFLELNGLKTLACDEKETGKEKTQLRSCPFQPFQRVREVWLRGNQFETIDQAALPCFHKANILSLADNAIKSLDKKVFQSFQQLSYLDLSGNLLTVVPEGMFVNLPGLKYLSLARNRLGLVPAGLPMLQWLDLSHNAITSVSESQKSDLYPQEVFLIGGNPFHCKCDMLWLKELFDTREYLLKYIEVDMAKFIPACASPDHLRGDMWDVLGDDAFGCKDIEETAKEGSANSPPSPELMDWSMKAKDVGTTHIRLTWDSLSMGYEKPSERREPRRVLINCHPFGKKQEKSSAVAQLSLGTHRLRGLQPSTAYIVCISLADMSSGEPQMLQGGDCIEVVTKDDQQTNLRDVYMRIGLVVLVSFLLSVKCCYANSVRKDISSRQKTQ